MLSVEELYKKEVEGLDSGTEELREPVALKEAEGPHGRPGLNQSGVTWW